MMSSVNGPGENHSTLSICASCWEHSHPTDGISYTSSATSEFLLHILPLRTKQLYLTITLSSSLTPGGWIEQIELDVRVYSDDGTLKEDGVLATWGDNFIGCSERAGRSLLTQETMRGAMEKAGFVDVQEKPYKIPLGPWPRDKVLKEVGQLQYAHWVAALEGWAMWLLTKFGAPTPWTQQEVQVYLSKVRAELRNPRTHAYEYA